MFVELSKVLVIASMATLIVVRKISELSIEQIIIKAKKVSPHDVLMRLAAVLETSNAWYFVDKEDRLHFGAHPVQVCQRNSTFWS